MKAKVKKCTKLAVLIGLVTLAYSYINTFFVKCTEYTYTSSKLQNNYKILFISDIHYGHKQDKRVLQHIISKFNGLKPDIVILGGDIAMEEITKEDMQEVFKLLGNIKSTYGTYYIYGNHDKPRIKGLYNYTLDELIEAITSNNITILEDNYIILNNELLLLGRKVANKDHHNNSVKELLPDNSDEYYNIVVDHIPCGINDNVNNNIDLQLSGHTHAGQIFPINLIVAYKDLPVYGEYISNNLKIIVSSGFGVGKIKLRNMKHCEYVIVNLESEK